VGDAVHGHAPLLHGLEQRCLRLGGSAIDLVPQDEVAEDGARAKREGSLGGEQIHSGDVGGHQIGGELNPTELEAQRETEGPDQEGLGSPRNPFEQDVAARQEGGDRLAYRRLLPQHDAAQCPDQIVRGLGLASDPA
jgi:hypothetical protein